jgi:hypothetical protein
MLSVQTCRAVAFAILLGLCCPCSAADVEIGKVYRGEFGGEKRTYNPIGEIGGHRGWYYQTEVVVKLKAGEDYTFDVEVSKNSSVSIRITDPKGDHTGEGSSVPDLQKHTFSRKIEDVHVTGEYKVLLACDKIGKFDLKYSVTGDSDAPLADEDEIAVLESRQSQLIEELHSVTEKLRKLRKSSKAAR